MKIIICGAGQVGYGIAEKLVAEKNDVSVIDIKPHLIHKIRDTLDARGFIGHGSHPDILEAAGAEEADMIIAATLYDEVNIVACEVAHTLFDIPMKIARIRSQAYLKSHYMNLSREHAPIDVIISPETEGAATVLQRIAFPGANDIVGFVSDKITMISVECPDNCPILSTPLSKLSSLFPDLSSIIVGIDRKGKLFAARSSDQLLAGDRVHIITRKDQVKRTLTLLGHEEPEASRIVIAGGGNIGLHVARALEERQYSRIKIIEENPTRAAFIAGELRETVVLHGSALDQKLLAESEVKDADLIISLTNSDHVNILSSAIAKQMGCSRNLVLINDTGYFDLGKSIGIDSYINIGNITISRVLQHVRRGRIRGIYTLDKGAAEVIEVEAFETSPLVGAPLAQLNLPHTVRIGAIYRDDEFIKPLGSLQIRPRDRVIIFSLADSVKHIEQLCRVNLDFF